MASNYPTIAIAALDAQSTGTRVVFEWRDDRYHHAIYGVCLGEAVLLAESVERDAVSPWPPSPPLQQLHKQQRDIGGEVLFATGMAGKSHWSGSVATTVDQRGSEVMFEFACRYRVRPDWLGVTYRVADGIHAEQLHEGDAVLFKVNDSLQYSLSPSPFPIGIATENILASEIELSANTIRIAAIPIPHTTTATTTRWEYSVRLTLTPPQRARAG